MSDEAVGAILKKLDSHLSEHPTDRVYSKKLSIVKDKLKEKIDDEPVVKEAAFDTDKALTIIDAHENSISSLPPPVADWLFSTKIKRRLGKIIRKLKTDEKSVKPSDESRRCFFSKSIIRRICEEQKFLTESTNSAFRVVMTWLLRGEKESELDIFGIVGRVGVGKTLLARKIFENKQVKQRFSFKFWVDIPNNCNEEGAVRAMLRALSGYRYSNIIGAEYGKDPKENLRNLMNAIKGRYLLVLNNSDHSDTNCTWWDDFKPYILPHRGNKVLVISNEKKVDSSTAVEYLKRQLTFTLKPLSEEEGLVLFRASHEKKVDLITEEQELAMLRKCDGLPIAINAMGAMLAHKDPKEWSDVLNELENVKEEDAVKACLRLCYEDLDDSCKECFLSLSIFGEEGIEIDKMSLIYWWIGESLVPSKEKGIIVFEKLVGRSLVEGNKTGKGKIYSCRVHLFVRKLLLEEMNLNEQFERPHRLSFCTELKATELDNGDKKPVVSILQVGDEDPNYMTLPVRKFPELKNLTVLHLGWWQKSAWFHVEISTNNFLSSLCYLEKLKYLSLRGISGITKLPKSIKKLKQLQILDLRACYDLEKLPKEITLLKELTHLDTSRCYFLEFMPKGLGKLSKLESLRGFKLGNSRNMHCCRLQELQNLKQLSKLSVRIWRQSEIQENDLESFKNFHVLTALRLEFGYQEPKSKIQEKDNDDFVTKLNQLRPPPNLSKLELLCYPGKETPTWLKPSSLCNLKTLYFSGGPLQTLGCLFVSGPPMNDANPNKEKVKEKTWKLESMCLRFLAHLQGCEKDIKEAMPKLELKVHECRPGFAMENHGTEDTAEFNDPSYSN